MANQVGFIHPAFCPLNAVCATNAAGTEGWLCHDGIHQPEKCNKDAIMLLGRRTRAKIDQTYMNGLFPTPCIKDGDFNCFEGGGEKCYARRCVPQKISGDEERLHVYVNGACGSISPHVEAVVDVKTNVDAGTSLADIRCKVTNGYGNSVLTISEEYTPQKLNAFGQILEIDEIANKARTWDTRAKAEACSLCSLYTARHVNTHAWIKKDTYWSCSVFANGHTGATNEENCTALFGDNIFVARENIRELESIGLSDAQPAYLVSGVVPRNLNEEWKAHTFSPPLFDSDGAPYIDTNAFEASYYQVIYGIDGLGKAVVSDNKAFSGVDGLFYYALKNSRERMRETYVRYSQQQNANGEKAFPTLSKNTVHGHLIDPLQCIPLSPGALVRQDFPAILSRRSDSIGLQLQQIAAAIDVNVVADQTQAYLVKIECNQERLDHFRNVENLDMPFEFCSEVEDYETTIAVPTTCESEIDPNLNQICTKLVFNASRVWFTTEYADYVVPGFDILENDQNAIVARRNGRLGELETATLHNLLVYDWQICSITERFYDNLRLPQLSGLYTDVGDGSTASDLFSKMWSFINFATADDYNPNFLVNGELNYRSKLYGPNLKNFVSATPLNYIVPSKMCEQQPSYCCLNGPRVNGVTVEYDTRFYYEDGPFQGGYRTDKNFAQNVMTCGFGMEKTYGLNHAYRVQQCKFLGGNFNRKLENEEFYGSDGIGTYRKITEIDANLGPNNIDENKFAADVLVVPRSWDSRLLVYGWARLNDLFDVDRRIVNLDTSNDCKYEGLDSHPYRDYCLRRDRGIGSAAALCYDPNTVEGETEAVFVLTSGIQQGGPGEENARKVCCDEDGKCDELCKIYVSKIVPTTTTTLPTTTTTTGPEILLSKLVWPLVVDDNGLFSYPDDSTITFSAAYESHVCSINYAYYAQVPAPDDIIFGLNFVDTSSTAHTKCRDACTAWKSCMGYGYFAENSKCSLYATGNKFSRFLLDLGYVRNSLSSFTIDILNNVIGEAFDIDVDSQYATDFFVIAKNIEANFEQIPASELDTNIVVQKQLILGTHSGENAVDSFDLYYGYQFCDDDKDTVALRTSTLDDCMAYARQEEAEAFTWFGRLHRCNVLKPNLVVGTPQPVEKCSGDATGDKIAMKPGDNFDANTPVLGIVNVDTDKKCPPLITTTTTTETVSSGTSVEQQKAVYASLQRFCGTTEERYIYPVFAVGDDTDDFREYSVYIDDSSTFVPFDFDIGGIPENQLIYLNLKLRPRCTEERPPLSLVYGDNVPSTVATTTTTTTTTPTFPNRFTDEDSRVTLGVVIGVLAVGAVLSAVAAWKQ